MTDRDRGRAGRSDRVLYARDVTTGDDSAQQPAPARPAKRPAAKRPAAKTSAAAKEPRTSTAKATPPGKASPAKKRAPRAVTPQREADVLERLNKLEPEVIEETLSPMPIALPAIVEADPSFPPLSAPATEQLAGAAILDAPAPLTNGTSNGTSNGHHHPDRHPDRSGPIVAPAAAAVAATALSDAPTQLVTAAAPTMLVPDVLPEVPDRTDVVPTVLAPAPTVAMPHELTEGLTDLDVSTGMPLPMRPLQSPVTFRRGKPRVRRVTRVVRHVDTWSVFKVALVFNAILFVVCLTSGVLLWNVANATGTVDNVEKFFEQFGWSSFEFKGGELYHSAWVAGLFVAIGLTGFAVLLATLFNLITDLVGGVRVSVLEEEVVARSSNHPAVRRRRARRTVATEPAVPAPVTTPDPAADSVPG